MTSHWNRQHWLARLRQSALGMACAVLFMVCSSVAHAQNSMCQVTGYTVAFFNGVFNTEAEARQSVEVLRSTLPSQINGESLRVELLYNETGKKPGSLKSYLKDLKEVFQQRSAEHGGAWDRQMEFFWASIAGTTPLWSDMTTVLSSHPSIWQGWQERVHSYAADALNEKNLAPLTLADYQNHDLRITTLLNERQKLLLVAHSQGNLFLNHAYPYAQAIAGAGSVQALHIAAASTRVNGEYLTASIDEVIGWLRVLTLGKVPAPNFILLSNPFKDFSGHGMIETYLDDNVLRDSRSRVRSLALTALGKLKTPNTQSATGFFSVTLVWDGPGDVDLHVIEPGGVHVSHRRYNGVAGAIDIDNVSGFGPEHYLASCNPAQLRLGTYAIGINNYSGAQGRRARLQIATLRDGVIYNTLATSILLGPDRGSAGDANPQIVAQLTLSQDSTGKTQFKVQ